MFIFVSSMIGCQFRVLRALVSFSLSVSRRRSHCDPSTCEHVCVCACACTGILGFFVLEIIKRKITQKSIWLYIENCINRQRWASELMSEQWLWLIARVRGLMCMCVCTSMYARNLLHKVHTGYDDSMQAVFIYMFLKKSNKELVFLDFFAAFSYPSIRDACIPFGVWCSMCGSHIFFLKRVLIEYTMSSLFFFATSAEWPIIIDD